MTKRSCATPGCPTLIPAGRTRCPACQRKRDKARGTRQSRGYDANHDRLRASVQRMMDLGGNFQCWRCGEDIDPSRWTWGHCDIDRTRYHGPECPACDYATAGRTGCPHASHSRKP